ncbi:porin [Vreelandella aquamarina]|uniref:Outer membrane protein (Porin) n=1 Tax=Vreelandella aquamarina TaxID=77097 RepID=A0A1N6FY95_9GAMM|nr:porin [Halomonas meridiana]GED47522.1 porin [Halomonas meridiana]SIN61102.1 Outer membrane protein (porin) [Halomonas meridiana]SIN66129.1 Outer membrane protein (porin) [Halomonas meridiana]SIO00233.1 Outer membrane protein (porin) [Halomonas meridiana]
MKKTLLATAVIGALGASAAAQAATVYDQDGTRLDVYGRIAMGIEGGGPEFNSDNEAIDNSAEFVDVFSRLGLRMSQEVTSDLTAFGRLEWRFDGDESTTDGGFNELRQSYLGLQSKQYGTFQAGNFDSFYSQFVSQPFDVYIFADSDLEFAGHSKQSRGDSIGYYTPELDGFTAFLQLKYYSERGALEPVREEGNVVAAQGGVRYEQGPFTVGLGFVDDVVRGGGNGEMLGGLIGSYDVNDQFSVRLGYEGREHSYEGFGNGYDKVGLGGTYTTGPWAFTADIYDVSEDGANGDDRTAWALGSYYKVSSNFDVFLELNQRDQQSIDVTIGGGDGPVSVERADGDDIYYLAGARYHF